MDKSLHKVEGSIRYLDSIEVFLIDSGLIELAKATDLFELPNQFGVDHFPTYAKRVIVGGACIFGFGF